MKQILPSLFLLLFFVVFSRPVLATISFTIDNPVREGDYLIVDASISGISSSSAYIFGMFTNTFSPDYFGFTWGQKEDWVEYQATNKDFISNQLPILLRDSLQKIWVKPNFNNPGYKGPGDYFLKLKRYTGSSDNSAGESNSLTVYLFEPTPSPTITPTQTPTETSTPTPTATQAPTQATVTLVPTRTPTPTPVKTSTPMPKITVTTTPSVILANPGIQSETVISSNSASLSGNVFGDSTSSAVIEESTTESSEVIPDSIRNPSYEPQPKTNILKYTFIFGLIIASASGTLLYFRHRNG